MYSPTEEMFGDAFEKGYGKTYLVNL